MRSFFVLAFVFFSWFLPAENPLLAIVIMVKNEAAVIEKTLAPFADAGVHHFLVFDTGSTDGTQERVGEFFEQYAIANGFLAEEPFIDFATSRNHALECAEQIFPDATFFLMIDAEWYINDAPLLLEFCKQHGAQTAPNYWVTIRHHELGDCKLQRLLRASAHCRFKGVVHEYVTTHSNIGVPTQVIFEWVANDEGKEKTKQRLLRDIELLLQEYQRDPHEFHTVFFLAQCYEAYGDAIKSRLFYERSLALSKPTDIILWLIYYKLALLMHYAGEDVWPLALDYYLKAYAANPCRAEPLIRIADHYSVHGSKELTYLFSRQAIAIDFPHHETFTVEPYLYHFVRHDLFGSVAGTFGDLELGKKSIETALLVEPENQRLQNNLAWYNQFFKNSP